jgi:hypothetical protein
MYMTHQDFLSNQLEELLRSFTALNQHTEYLAEADEIDGGFNIPLPKDSEQWWLNVGQSARNTP